MYVSAQYKDLKKAIIGRDNYKLVPAYHKCYIVSESVWVRLSKKDKDKAFTKVLKDTKKAHLLKTSVTSRDEKLTVLVTPSAGKKPHQRKSKGAERTLTPSLREKGFIRDKIILVYNPEHYIFNDIPIWSL